MSAQLYLIWSEEHGRWWGPAQRGYTTSIREAGLYTLQEANDICTRANQFLEPTSFNEIAFPVPPPFENRK
jgi:hypothetical protein